MKYGTIAALLTMYTTFTYGQQKKECCTEGYCIKKEAVIKNEPVPVVCRLTAPEMQKRKNEVIKSLKLKIKDKQELEDGYLYTFGSTDTLIDEIATFFKTERQCCAFFTFNMLVEDDTIRLSITGPEGARDFIRTELEL